MNVIFLKKIFLQITEYISFFLINSFKIKIYQKRVWKNLDFAVKKAVFLHLASNTGISW